MSNDYAAILTTLNATVLIVGTVQHSSLMAKLGRRTAAEIRDLHDVMGQLIEDLRAGVESSPELLRRSSYLQKIAKKKRPYILTASFVWMVVCMLLISSQIDILKWAGAAKPGVSSGLARKAFMITVAAILVLAVEAIFSAGVNAKEEANKVMVDFNLKYPQAELYALANRQAERNLPQPESDTTTPDARP
ncbi:hypothetical protein [Streptomyces sp. CAU 1734]|uniref:hypothetical protein n=1 Tax=Streptomyces sp. CAU 1734 TaxID=3140360 RepID=UPI0032617CBD